jgi:uncharacterized protein YjbI with pentapeptide repeats
MTGGEIIAVGKAVGAVGKKALAEDEKTKDVLLRIAEGTPEMTVAARNMAARVAVKERVMLKLYQPFARMLGVSRAYFEDTFPEEMALKIAGIPEENLVTPAASIAVPALQGLSYTFEEPSLKELYLNLLATASDDRRSGQAHPAFAEIIKQLAPSEAKLLSVTLKVNSTMAARVKDQVGPRGAFIVLMSHLLPLVEETTDEPIEEPQAPTWIDNWRRLGLVDVDYGTFRTGDDTYDWVQSRPEYVRLANKPSITEITFEKGLIETTDFGRQFFRAVTDEHGIVAAQILGPAATSRESQTALEALEALQEQGRQLDRTLAEQRMRTLNERFATAAAQLGSNEPAVRLAGVYAMAGLADDWHENRQTCIDVLCAYLRMQYEPEPGPDAPEPEKFSFLANREIRHTVIRVISAHLTDGAAVPWQGADFNFTGVVFDGGDFAGCEFTGGRVDFGGAVFSSGWVGFGGAVFSGGSVDFGRAKFSGGWVDFRDAKFSDGRVGFGGAVFSGGGVNFEHAVFSGGKVSFSPAEFSGGKVSFLFALFCGGWVGFGGARFSGGQVSFRHAKFSDGTVGFGSVEFSGGEVGFENVEFSGGQVSFIASKFSGGEVSFGGARFSGGQVDFRGAKFSVGQGNFSAAEFSGSQVDFSSASWSDEPEFPSWNTWPPGVQPPGGLAPEVQ